MKDNLLNTVCLVLAILIAWFSGFDNGMNLAVSFLIIIIVQLDQIAQLLRAGAKND